MDAAMYELSLQDAFVLKIYVRVIRSRQRFGIEDLRLPSDEQWPSSVHVLQGCTWSLFSGPISCRLRIPFPYNTGNNAVQKLPQRSSATPLGFKG